MEIYIVTDLVPTADGLEFNAVYAFRSRTSAERCAEYMGNSHPGHELVLTPATVSAEAATVQVVTLIGDGGYVSTNVFDDYEDARDYIADVKDSHTDVKPEHDIVRIRARFSPSLLHEGFA